MHAGSTMPPAEALFRNFRNARAVLLNTGLSHQDCDAALRESFAAFYAGLALETADPRGMVAKLLESVTRHLDNQGLSAAMRHPVRRFLGRFKRAAA